MRLYIQISGACNNAGLFYANHQQLKIDIEKKAK